MLTLGGAGGRSKNHYLDRTKDFEFLLVRICCWKPRENRSLPGGFGPNPVSRNTRPKSSSKPYGNNGGFKETMVSPK